MEIYRLKSVDGLLSYSGGRGVFSLLPLFIEVCPLYKV